MVEFLEIIFLDNKELFEFGEERADYYFHPPLSRCNEIRI
jgi:hypothetical protein